MYDVIVIGLGPAGSTAAYTLASKGIKTLGIDKDFFPRDKPCGGCVSLKIHNTLDFDVSAAHEKVVYGGVFTYKSDRPVEINDSRPIGHNVMRDVFDDLLLQKAKEAGAETIEGCRVTSIENNGRSVNVKCEDGRTWNARFVVGADGASGFVGREYFGLSPKKCAVSITAEAAYDKGGFKHEGKQFIDFGGVPFGYAWVFPKKDCLSIGIASDSIRAGKEIKKYFDAFASTHPAVKGLNLTRRRGWTVPTYYGGIKSVKGRVILVGDTGHLVDPFLGEGIYYAAKTGKAGAEAIAGCIEAGSSEPASYQSWLETELVPEFTAADKLSKIIYTHPRLWYGILETEPQLMLRYYNVIRGEEDGTTFFNWVYGRIKSKPWKLLRSWIGSRSLPL